MRQIRGHPSGRLARAAVAGLTLLVASCASAVRPDDVSTAATFGSVPLFTAQGKPVVPPLGATITGDQVPLATATKELNVLAISGGGSDGAFGAGVLKGWTESGKRPVFNIVTGVSTGALIATFAFLGSQWDDDIERFYTRVTNELIYADQGIAGFFQDSLYDTGPFRSMVEKVVTLRLLDAVAEEHRKGRRLYVATTNLDHGTIVVWDMGGIAASGDEARVDTYRDVLVASAAFPGFFKPVYIRHSDTSGARARMHVDGGVKAPILLRSFMVEGKQRSKTVYMLVNSKLSLSAGTEAVPATVIGISKRSISELMRGLTYKTIYQGYVSARQAKAEFRILHVPDKTEDIDDALRFRPKEMRELFEVGRTLGRDPSNWLNEPPRLEPLERVDVRPATR